MAMTKEEMKDKIVALADEVQPHDPRAAGVLLSLAGAICMNATDDLFELTVAFAKKMIARLAGARAMWN
jgi:hypothetical protein